MSDEEYFEQLVSSSLDGTLTESEREKLDAHLAECPSCAALKQDLEQMRALFAAEAELPAGLHDSIMQRVRQEERLRVVQPEKPVRRLPVLTMVAAAAVVVLVVLGGGLMPAFSTVSSTNAADTATADAGAGSDGAGQMIRSAAEDAGLTGGSEEAAAAEESGQAENGAVQPRVTAPEESDGSTAGQSGGTQASGGETTDAAADGSAADGQSKVWAGLQPGTQAETGDSGQNAHPEASLADALPSITIPDSLRGSHVAHSYLATGGAEMPDINGELLYTGDGVSWFSLENSMTTLQETLQTLENAGFTVTTLDEVGLILDSKATTWLLAVATGV